MDIDKWIHVAQSCNGVTLDEPASATPSAVQVATADANKDAASASSAGKEEVDRYAHDMAQAKLMKTSRPHVGAHTDNAAEMTDDDLQLGLKGLERAKKYRLKGELEQALKLYELAIELLIRYLKPTQNSDSGDRSSVEKKVHEALSEAEAVKKSLAAQNLRGTAKPQRKSPSSGLYKQPSFEALSNVLSSVLGNKGKQKSPTNAAAAAAHRSRPNQRPIARKPASALHTTTPAARNTSPTTIAVDEIRQAVLSDFYVSPAEVDETKWQDIAGLANVKQALQETAILPLIRPDLFTGLRTPQNILLYGPPGTGKTMLVKAVAHESGSSLFVCTASALTSKWMGDGEKLVRKLFQVARELAPSILFMDEMDALLSSRKSEGEHEASRRLKTEFMVQMDGIKGNNNNTDAGSSGRHLLLIACTNCPWDVDSAVLRRFPRRIFVPLPDSEARGAMLEHLLKKADKHSLTSRQRSTLVKKLDGFSGSDISAVASEASFGPLRSLGGMEAIRGVRAKDVRPVQLQDFESVIKEATRSVTDEQLQKYDQWQKQQAA